MVSAGGIIGNEWPSRSRLVQSSQWRNSVGKASELDSWGLLRVALVVCFIINNSSWSCEGVRLEETGKLDRKKSGGGGFARAKRFTVPSPWWLACRMVALRLRVALYSLSNFDHSTANLNRCRQSPTSCIRHHSTNVSHIL